MASYLTLLTLVVLSNQGASAASSSLIRELYQQGQASFSHFNVDNGLSENTVRAIAQDGDGYLWIGTADGLNRFDAYRFKHFFHDPKHPESLSDNSINALLIQKGRIWVATAHGLNTIDLRSEKITRWHLVTQRDPSGNGQVITSLAISNNVLWVGTKAGLYKLDTNTGDVVPVNLAARYTNVTALAVWQGKLLVGSHGGVVLLDPRTGGSISLLADSAGPVINCMMVDLSGAIWAGTETGLWRLDIQGHVQAHFINDPRDSNSLSQNQVISLLETREGQIWIGTKNGLNKWSGSGNRFQRFYAQAADTASLTNNIIYSLYQDQTGLVWVGTLSGLDMLRQRAFSFGLITHNPSSSLSLADNNVFSIGQSRDQRLWIGTSSGVTVMDPGSHTSHDVIFPRRLSAEHAQPFVIAIGITHAGEVWAGTAFEGLFRIDPRTLRAMHVALPGIDGNVQPFVTAILEDRAGNLWCAHHQLYQRPAGSTHWRRYPLNLSGTASRRAVHLALDNEDDVWVSSYDGLARIDSASGKVTWFRSTSADRANVLRQTDILFMDVDGRDRLWFGTDGAGLGMLEHSHTATPSAVNFRFFTSADGLPSDTVYAVLHDAQNHIWFTSDRGLAELDPATAKLRRFGPGQGLQGWEFNEAAALATSSGLLMFGGPNGISFLDPSGFRARNVDLPVRLTGLRILNQPQTVPPDSLRLDYRDYLISFDFSGFDFDSSEQTVYRYRLRGLSNRWITLQGAHQATFTNLDPGTYEFQVGRASGPQTELTSLRVVVAPAPWRSPFAYIVYTAMFAGLGYLVIFMRVRAHRLEVRQERENAQRLEQLVTERTAQLEAKSRALEEASITDPLTGLHNRRYLYSRILQDMAAVRRRYARPAAQQDNASDMLFLICDIDKFKRINDEHGHHVGDQVLQEVARRIKRACRTSDTVVRWGGEEFLAVAMETNRDHFGAIFERLSRMVSQQPVLMDDGRSIDVTISIGACCYPFDARDWDTLSWENILEIADQALYAVKRSGRNGWLIISADLQRPPVVERIKSGSAIVDLAQSGEVRVESSIPMERIIWSDS